MAISHGSWMGIPCLEVVCFVCRGGLATRHSGHAPKAPRVAVHTVPSGFGSTSGRLVQNGQGFGGGGGVRAGAEAEEHFAPDRHGAPATPPTTVNKTATVTEAGGGGLKRES